MPIGTDPCVSIPHNNFPFGRKGCGAEIASAEGTRLIYTPLYATQPCEGGYPLFRENRLVMWGNPTAVAQHRTPDIYHSRWGILPPGIENWASKTIPLDIYNCISLYLTATPCITLASDTYCRRAMGTRQIPLTQLHIAAEHWKQDKQYSSPYISLYIYSQAKNNPEHTLPPCPAVHRSLTVRRATHTPQWAKTYTRRTPRCSRIILYY